MRQVISGLIVPIIAVLLLTGCQESQSSQIQRARLVGRDNLKLKKQIEVKNTEIAQLKKDIEQLQAAKDEAARKSGETNFRVMQIVAESEKQNAQLRQENAKLKAELEK